MLAAVVATACVFLARWQWDRREARLAANHLIETNYDRAPVELTSVLATAQTVLPTSATWTPVSVHGVYVPDATTLVRNRSVNKAAGFWVLVPLRADDGQVLLVNRGFVPTGETGERPDAIPTPPSGPVTVVARLRPVESADPRTAPDGQTYAVVPEALQADLAARSQGAFTADHMVIGAYAELGHEQPAAQPSPTPLPKPLLDEGPHLSYSIQWLIFAVAAIVGSVVVVRRTLEDERAERDLAAGHAPPPRPPRRRRSGPTDEDVEDALLDAAQVEHGPRRFG